MLRTCSICPSHGDSASGHRVRIDELVQMPAGDLLNVPTTFPGLLRHAVIRRPEQQIPAWPVVPATRHRNLLLVVAQRKPRPRRPASLCTRSLAGAAVELGTSDGSATQSWQYDTARGTVQPRSGGSPVLGPSPAHGDTASSRGGGHVASSLRSSSVFVSRRTWSQAATSQVACRASRGRHDRQRWPLVGEV